MSHAVELPDDLYRMLAAYAAQHDQTLEETIRTWADAASRGSGGHPSPSLSGEKDVARVENPAFDPWAGFRGTAVLLSPDSLDQHDAYLAQEALRDNGPNR